MTTETENISSTAQNFELGRILHNVNANKYTNEINESFTIEGVDTKAKFKMKKEIVHELAESLKDNDEAAILMNNGWPASEKMSAGSSHAVKIVKMAEWYECTFFTGELGKPFDPKKIVSKSFIKLSNEHLGAIFTFLRCNDEVEKIKAEEKRIERTTLDLG